MDQVLGQQSAREAELPLAAFDAEAVLVGERLDLRDQSLGERLAIVPLAVRPRTGGVAILFRYGVVVFCGMQDADKEAFLAELRPRIGLPMARPERETTAVRVVPDAKEGVQNGAIVLVDAGVQRLQLLADALARSVVLAYYEQQVAQAFERIEPLASNLEIRGLAGRRSRDLLRYIGRGLLSQHTLIGRVELADKPELLWERGELEGLWLRLEHEFEIRERDVALRRKIDLINTTANTALELLHNRRSLRVEWYIVLLIVFDILLSLAEKYFGW